VIVRTVPVRWGRSGKGAMVTQPHRRVSAAFSRQLHGLTGGERPLSDGQWPFPASWVGSWRETYAELLSVAYSCQ
jgi:hypothetical protein